MIGQKQIFDEALQRSYIEVPAWRNNVLGEEGPRV